MTALLIVYRGRDVVRMCDAACYDADHDRCVCVSWPWMSGGLA